MCRASAETRGALAGTASAAIGPTHLPQIDKKMTLADAAGACYSTCAYPPSPILKTDYFAVGKVNSPCIIRTGQLLGYSCCHELMTVAHFPLAAYSDPTGDKIVSSGTLVILASLSATSAEHLRFFRMTLQRCDCEIPSKIANSSCVVSVASIHASTLA